jgi:hypothetical protein
VEEAGALAGEATGGGGRGARRWWGGARYSRKRCSPVEEAWGGRGTGAMSGVAGSVGQCGVERVAWAGRARGVGWLDARGLVGRLDRSIQVMDLCSITLGNE